MREQYPENPLHTKFEADKQATIDATEAFLKNPPEPVAINPALYRDAATEAIKIGNFTKALQNLERARDAKSGIAVHDREVNGVRVTIRDARAAKTAPVRETEAFEMQYLNAIRAAIDLVELEDKKTTEQKNQLKNALISQAQNFGAFSSNQTQKELSEKLKGKTDDLAALLKQNGIADAHKKLNVAKDFQNFNDTHSNTVTLSSVKGHTVVEAEVAMKGLTDDQKAQYDDIAEGREPEPKWYKAMAPWEKKLCERYSKKIAAGEHVIPTQLRQIAGMKNAFEKITALGENSGGLNILHTSKHAGTLASLARDKKAREEVTNENVRQAQAWLGNKRLHCNTLNSGPLFGKGDDREIVRSTKKAMKTVNGKYTNTAFNGFRFTGLASDLEGANSLLKEISDNLSSGQDFAKIRSYLQPENRFVAWLKKRLGFDIKNPKGEIDLLLDRELINPPTAAILRMAVELKEATDKVSAIFNTNYGENPSLAVSTKLNLLNRAISTNTTQLKGFAGVIGGEEMLTMCASGKDRTGLAEHDQTAQIIATALDISVQEVDRQLLKSGHTAHQAGGIGSGGGTIGCYGTKSENKRALPEDRKESLSTIVEQSAQSNKIEKGSHSQATKPKEPQESLGPVVGQPARDNETEKALQRKATKYSSGRTEVRSSGKTSPSRDATATGRAKPRLRDIRRTW